MTCASVFHVFCAISLALRLPLALSLHNDLNEAKFYKLEGKSLNGNVTERLLTRDVLDCSFLCVNAFKKKSCLSFNFGGSKEQGLYECELNNLDMNLKLGKTSRPTRICLLRHDKKGRVQRSCNFCLKAALMNLRSVRCFEICRFLKLKSTFVR